MKSILTAELLLREIYLAETELRWFEQKYGLLSETFYQLYEQGRLRDEEFFCRGIVRGGHQG